jgi:hypothetical protein
VLAQLANERDLYEFINDQTLNLINKGYTPIEIAEMLRVPAGRFHVAANFPSGNADCKSPAHQGCLRFAAR